MVSATKELPPTYLTFTLGTMEGKLKYKITNIKGEHLGYIEKVRIGKWMSWCLFLLPDCYMSASCLDETRAFIKQCNSQYTLV